MTWEQLWYQSFDAEDPPKCKRSNRLPMEQQLTICIELAIEFAEGKAGYLNYRHSLTREWYWYFRDRWWMISHRTVKRAMFLYQEAGVVGCRANGGQFFESDRIKQLNRWKKSGKWRKKIAHIVPQTVSGKKKNTKKKNTKKKNTKKKTTKKKNTKKTKSRKNILRERRLKWQGQSLSWIVETEKLSAQAVKSYAKRNNIKIK